MVVCVFLCVLDCCGLWVRSYEGFSERDLPWLACLDANLLVSLETLFFLLPINSSILTSFYFIKTPEAEEPFAAVKARLRCLLPPRRTMVDLPA